MNLWRKLFYTLFYLRRPPWDSGISPPELMAFIESHPPGKALDLGCGTGTNAITLARHGWQTTGVDFVGSAIRQAHRKARQAGLDIDFRQGDVTQLQNIRSGPFDLVLDIGCLHSLTPQGKAAYIANLEQLLAPGGTFLVYAFCADASSGQMVLEQPDLDLLGKTLHLVDRQDGWERGQKPSAWLTYEK
ncbi:MAG: class I SAM-dependent methyltransferase [Chloroflexota bacterium]